MSESSYSSILYLQSAKASMAMRSLANGWLMAGVSVWRLRIKLRLKARNEENKLAAKTFWQHIRR
jgi:hypothetical protein